MKRMFITGDTHRLRETSRIEEFDNRIGKSLTADDYLVIVGDFGGIWTGQKIRNSNSCFKKDICQERLGFDDEAQQYWEKKPYTILFIDGNHENHDALNQYPIEEWNGGKVHKIYKNTFHLMRGQVFTINGKTCFTLGGAETTDMDGREEGVSWWKSEIPNREELEEALINLNKCNFAVDYIFTHCCPERIIRKQDVSFDRAENALTRFLDTLIAAYHIRYKGWYFGHYHIDRDFDNMHCLYNRIVEVSL